MKQPKKYALLLLCAALAGLLAVGCGKTEPEGWQQVQQAINAYKQLEHGVVEMQMEVRATVRETGEPYAPFADLTENGAKQVMEFWKQEGYYDVKTHADPADGTFGYATRNGLRYMVDEDGIERPTDSGGAQPKRSRPELPPPLQSFDQFGLEDIKRIEITKAGADAAYRLIPNEAYYKRKNKKPEKVAAENPGFHTAWLKNEVTFWVNAWGDIIKIVAESHDEQLENGVMVDIEDAATFTIQNDASLNSQWRTQ